MNKEKNNKNKKRKNKRGFTLIELLAVIIILGVLLLIAIPAVSRYIEDSRMNTYVNSVKSIASAVSTSVNALEYPALRKDEALIIPFKEVNLEKETAKTRSPYANYIDDKSYVVVSFDGARYNYYVVAIDEAGYAIPFINVKDLSKSSVTANDRIINNNIHSVSEIYNKNLSSQKIIDTSNLTFKAYNDNTTNIIRVQLCETIYKTGDVIQLKDGTKWYVMAESDEETKTVNLVSYNHMDTNVYNHGKQSNSKTEPTIVFDDGGNTDYYTADIYATANSIISSAYTDLVSYGLDLSGADVDMPLPTDFIESGSYGTYSSQLSYLSNDGGFWTKTSRSNYIVTINKTSISGTSPRWGVEAIHHSQGAFGIRVVIRNLLKSNIDKDATKALS